jgi:hypothetical protein
MSHDDKQQRQSQHQRQRDDLTPFEAALAALKPRVEGFDRERLIFLAGQAAALRDAGVSPAEFTARETHAEVSARETRAPRWVWPAAFSAMTAVAAALMVMLYIRPVVTVAIAQPKDASSGVESKVVAVKSPDSQPRRELAAPSMAREEEFAVATFLDVDPALRAELHRRGLDFNRSRATAASAPTVVAEAPMTYFELLSRLQGQEPAGQRGLKELMQ